MPLLSRKKTPSLTVPHVPRTGTYIEEGCTLSGQLTFQSGVRIDGRVEGEIRARGTVVVGETGSADASIFADVVVVLGEVDGDITAQTLVALHKGARVRSDICTAGIVVEPGSNFRGSIVIGPEEALALSEETPAAAEPEDASEDDAFEFEEGVSPIVRIHSEERAGGLL